MDKLTIQQFGATIKQKYPQYKDFSDYEIGQKTLKKYPQYGEKVTFTYDVPEVVETKQSKLGRLQSEAQKATEEAKKETSILGYAKNFGKALVENLAPSEVGLGKTIGKLAGNQTDTYSKLIQDVSSQQANLIKAIKEKESKGGDATALKRIYNDNVKQLSELNKSLQEENNLPTTGQVIGQLGGTALDVLTAGTYGKAKTAGMATLKLAPKASTLTTKIATATGLPELVKIAEQKASGILTKKGALNVAKGAGLGYASDVTLGLQGLRGEDRTGGNAFILGLGTAIGTAIPAVSETTQSFKNRFDTSPEAINKARQEIAATYEKTLNLTPSQKTKELNLLKKTGDNIYTTLVKHNINLGADDAIKQIDDVSELYSTQASNAQKNEGAYFNLSKTLKDTFSRIDEYAPSETSAKAAKDKIQKEIDLLLSKNKASIIRDVDGNIKVKSDLIEKLRKTANSWANYNKLTDPESISRSAGFSLADAVRDTVEKEGTFPTYREVMREWGKLIHAKEVLSKLETSGKNQFKTLGGLSGSISRKILSGSIGYSTGGLGGLVLGEIGSESGARVLSDPRLRTFLDKKLVQNANKKQTTELIAKLAKEVQDEINRIVNVTALPSPSFIPTGAKTQTMGKVEMIPAQKNPVSINPKTGKFQTSYSSQVDIPPITKQSKITPKINIPSSIPQSTSKVNTPTMDTIFADVKKNITMAKNIVTNPTQYGKTSLNATERLKVLTHIKEDAIIGIQEMGKEIPEALKNLQITSLDTPYNVGQKILKIIKGIK